MSRKLIEHKLDDLIVENVSEIVRSNPPSGGTLEYHSRMREGYDMFLATAERDNYYLKGDFFELASILVYNNLGINLDLERTHWKERCRDWKFMPFKVSFMDKKIFLRFINNRNVNSVNPVDEYRVHLMGFGDVSKKYISVDEYGHAKYSYTVFTDYISEEKVATLRTPWSMYTMDTNRIWSIWDGGRKVKADLDDMNKLIPFVREMQSDEWLGHFDDIAQLIFDSGIDAH